MYFLYIYQEQEGQVRLRPSIQAARESMDSSFLRGCKEDPSCAWLVIWIDILKTCCFLLGHHLCKTFRLLTSLQKGLLAKFLGRFQGGLQKRLI